MDVCLMIEGQEGVTWDQWVTLARDVRGARVRGVVPFRPLPVVLGVRRERGALDAWATISALGASPNASGSARWSRRSRSGTRRSSRRSSSRRTTRREDASSSAWEPAGSTASTWRSGSRSRPVAERLDLLTEQVEIVHRLSGGDGDGGRLRREALSARVVPGVPGAAPGPAPAAHHRGRGRPALGGARRAVGRRVRHRIREPGGGTRAVRSGVGGVRGDRPRSGDRPPIRDPEGGRRGRTRPRFGDGRPSRWRGRTRRATSTRTSTGMRRDRASRARPQDRRAARRVRRRRHPARARPAARAHGHRGGRARGPRGRPGGRGTLTSAPVASAAGRELDDVAQVIDRTGAAAFHGPRL